MSEEVERSDTYYEVQVDRETLVLLGFGFVALLIAAFLVGRWTAPVGVRETEDAVLLDAESTGADAGERASSDAIQDVDGEPLFGGTPVSAEGAPPIGAVPEKPLPERASVEPEATSEPAPALVVAKPATETIPAAAAEGWVVQVSAVKSSRDAKALQARLEAKGWPVRVVREGGYSKVQVGPFAKRSEADAAERRLKREDRLSTWVKHS